MGTGVIDLRENFGQQMQFAQNLGGSLGMAYAGYKKGKADELVGVLMANPDMNAEQRHAAMAEIPFASHTYGYKKTMEDMEQEREQQKRIDYQLNLKNQLYDQSRGRMADQGFTPEEMMQADKYEAGVVGRPRQQTPQQIKAEQVDEEKLYVEDQSVVSDLTLPEEQRALSQERLDASPIHKRVQGNLEKAKNRQLSRSDAYKKLNKALPEVSLLGINRSGDEKKKDVLRKALTDIIAGEVTITEAADAMKQALGGKPEVEATTFDAGQAIPDSQPTPFTPYMGKVDPESQQQLDVIIKEGDPAKVNIALKRLRDKYGDV